MSKKHKAVIVVAALFVLIGCHSKKTDFQLGGRIMGNGTPVGEFKEPSGIIVERMKSPFGLAFFVADRGNDRILILPDRKPNMYFSFGSQGEANGQFNGPVGVAVTRSDPINSSIPPPDDPRIFVTDSRNNRIQVFDINGQFIKAWGSYGNDTSNFYNPTGIDIDFDGFIYVVDSGNNRVQIFDTSGNFIRMFGGLGSDAGKFNGLVDISVVFGDDLKEFKYIAVSDNHNNRLQLFDRLGNFVKEKAGLISPLGICSGDRVIYILSESNKSLYRYYYDEEKLFVESINEMSSPFDVTSRYYITDRTKNAIYYYFFNVSY